MADNNQRDEKNIRAREEAIRREEERKEREREKKLAILKNQLRNQVANAMANLIDVEERAQQILNELEILLDGSSLGIDALLKSHFQILSSQTKNIQNFLQRAMRSGGSAK